MRHTARFATGVVAFGITGLAAMPAAVAQTVDCAVYPDRCVESDVVVDRQPVGVIDTVQDREEEEVASTQDREEEGTTTATNPATLPFTGGEVALLSAVGAGTLLVGTALVVAGRRRAGSTA